MHIETGCFAGCQGLDYIDIMARADIDAFRRMKLLIEERAHTLWSVLALMLVPAISSFRLS
jgi:hypothetical protein